MSSTIQFTTAPRSRQLQIALLASFVGLGLAATTAWTGWLVVETISLVSSLVG